MRTIWGLKSGGWDYAMICKMSCSNSGEGNGQENIENLEVKPPEQKLLFENCCQYFTNIYRFHEWLFISHLPPNHCQTLLVHPESIDLAEMPVCLHRSPQGLVKAIAAAHVAVVRGTCTGDATTSLTQSGAGLANSLPGTRTTLPWRSARKAAG